METILIIDDEKDLVHIISDSLEKEGYNTLTAYNGYDGIELIKENPDLIILDIMMPDIDGYHVCRSIRGKINVPIIFLSAKIEEQDKIKGLGIGGDDYITKPFSMKELISRVKAHLRREKRYESNDEINYLKYKGLTIDFKSKAVYINGENINLTKKEYEIIELLILNKNQVFSKDNIYDKVWDYNSMGDSSTVTEHIKKIRYKLNEYDNIKTVWGIGYKWEE